MQDKPSLRKATFKKVFDQIVPRPLLRKILNWCGPLKRRPPTLKANQLIQSLVFHVLQGAGTLAEHVKELTGISVSNSDLSQRRRVLPWQVFETLMEEVLKPKADPKKHPEAFYKGLRLCGIDGSQFPVSNTPQNGKGLHKARSRRMKAAFARIGACVMVELGLRNPIAATIGPQGESELALARPLVDRLPPKSLSIWDRLYGVGVIFKTIFEVFGGGGGREALMRVRHNLKAKVQWVLRDGSARVEIRVGKQKLTLREIHGKVRRPKGKWTRVRLWTTLLDETLYPARELLALYGRRWEQEVFFKELKVELREDPLLQSHTPLTAAQEIAALLIAHAMLVEARMKAAAVGEVEVLQISFLKTLRWVRALWQIIELGEGILSDEQVEKLIRRMLRKIADSVVGPRRKRSCLRAVRQPIKGWPRLLKTRYQLGPTQYRVLTATP